MYVTGTVYVVSVDLMIGGVLCPVIADWFQVFVWCYTCDVFYVLCLTTVSTFATLACFCLLHYGIDQVRAFLLYEHKESNCHTTFEVKEVICQAHCAVNDGGFNTKPQRQCSNFFPWGSFCTNFACKSSDFMGTANRWTSIAASEVLHLESKSFIIFSALSNAALSVVVAFAMEMLTSSPQPDDLAEAYWYAPRFADMTSSFVKVTSSFITVIILQLVTLLPPVLCLLCVALAGKQNQQRYGRGRSPTGQTTKTLELKAKPVKNSLENNKAKQQVNIENMSDVTTEGRECSEACYSTSVIGQGAVVMFLFVAAVCRLAYAACSCLGYEVYLTRLMALGCMLIVKCFALSLIVLLCRHQQL
ncbi:hypothetical protein BaRGS_00024761 [Batillaria attramentaria]|uniref:Uncharacterized protein n=1 Tax=Batillaria attramentaria TaxID=370345 RepID=A0ABD0KAM4_9CAEN